MHRSRHASLRRVGSYVRPGVMVRSRSSVSHRVTIVLGTVALALAASGCSTSSDPQDWPIATYPNVPDNGSSLMSLTGELRMVDDCVVVVAEEDGRVYLPVFRTPGTQWRGGKVRLDDKTLKPGETAHFDGGGSPLPGSFIRASCADVTRYFLVYTFSVSK